MKLKGDWLVTDRGDWILTEEIAAVVAHEMESCSGTSVGKDWLEVHLRGGGKIEVTHAIPKKDAAELRQWILQMAGFYGENEKNVG